MRVTFGRYQPRNSLIHAMDGRFKMIIIILLMITIFLPIGLSGYIICGAVILGMFALSKLNFRMLLGLFPPVLFVFVIILFMNSLISHPESSDELLKTLDKIDKHKNLFLTNHGWYSVGRLFVSPKEWESLGLVSKDYYVLGSFFKVGGFWFSEKSFYMATMMGLRIYFMITLTCILTGTTSPLQLTLAIEDILTPLKFIGIPIYIISMIISIALRMIPTLIDEAGRIMKAQASRGIDVKNGKLKDKAKGMASLIIPLLVSSFQKAEDLAYAMESRGYNPYAKRTRYIQFKFHVFDLLLLIFSVAFLIFMILVAFQILPISIKIPALGSIDKIITGNVK
ncbi:cobalt ABC transporter permease [Entomoplasma ellychniae]|uniref:Cobalt ABC transporter permease n=1 Tax=Entomoplasma ellychniae TaxID=2114 RepID=A0A8E2UAX0_9MOLU|nr:energy-coupling factor transporter transmembrane protein EcfT [Entomoplasma ellychniae]PPE04951.1 cobalt ABC transporter permease [Entomoplasma ellychniae]